MLILQSLHVVILFFFLSMCSPVNGNKWKICIYTLTSATAAPATVPPPAPTIQRYTQITKKRTNDRRRKKNRRKKSDHAATALFSFDIDFHSHRYNHPKLILILWLPFCQLLGSFLFSSVFVTSLALCL